MCMSVVGLLLLMFLITWLLWMGQTRVIMKTDGPIKKRKRSAVCALCVNFALFCIFVKFFVFREISNTTGGTDAYVYAERFLNATGGLVQGVLSQKNEIGYALLVYIVRCLTKDFRVYLVVYYTLLLLLINNINKNVIKTHVSFITTFLFITLNIITSLCLMRNQLSCFLAFNSIMCFTQKKKAKSGLFFVLAVSCHYSAIIILVGYILFGLYKKLHFSTPKFVLFLGLAALFLWICGIYASKILVNTRYGVYLLNSGDVGYGQIVRLIVLFFVIFITYRQVKMSNITKKHMMQVADLFLIFPMQTYLSVLYRTFTMANYSQLVLLNDAYYENRKRKKFMTVQMFNIGAFILLVLELYLFFTQTVPSYGLLGSY